MEMEALRLQNDALKAENARLKETRAAIYKLYLEAEGKSGLHHPFTRGTVFKALQLSADPDRVKKEPAPNSGRKPKAKPDEVAPAEEVKVEAEPEVEPEVKVEAEPDGSEYWAAIDGIVKFFRVDEREDDKEEAIVSHFGDCEWGGLHEFQDLRDKTPLRKKEESE